MRVLTHLQFTGRKAKTGRICFDENGKMVVFVDYCGGCKGKVVMSRDEAKEFARHYHSEEKTFWVRFLDRIIAKRQVPVTPLMDANLKESIRREVLQELLAKAT